MGRRVENNLKWHWSQEQQIVSIKRGGRLQILMCYFILFLSFYVKMLG